MEDQQSASGDLTQKSVANGESTDTASAATEGHRGEIDAAGEPDERGAAVADSQADEDDSAATAARGGKTRARRSRGRRLAITVGVAAALFVGSAAFAGATVEPYLSERAVVATKLMVARTAANAITTLWTYTPENMDTLADRAANYLSGDFAAQYRIRRPDRRSKQTGQDYQRYRGHRCCRGIAERPGCRCHRLHQHHDHQSGDQEHPSIEVSVLPAVHEAL